MILAIHGLKVSPPVSDSIRDFVSPVPFHESHGGTGFPEPTAMNNPDAAQCHPLVRVDHKETKDIIGADSGPGCCRKPPKRGTGSVIPCEAEAIKVSGFQTGLLLGVKPASVSSLPGGPRHRGAAANHPGRVRSSPDCCYTPGKVRSGQVIATSFRTIHFGGTERMGVSGCSFDHSGTSRAVGEGGDFVEPFPLSVGAVVQGKYWPPSAHWLSSIIEKSPRTARGAWCNPR